MAVGTPLLRKKSVLAAKVETAVGTAEALTAADATFNIFDAEIQPTIDFAERPGQAGFSPLPGVPGARGGTCTFTTDIIGRDVSSVEDGLIQFQYFVGLQNVFQLGQVERDWLAAYGVQVVPPDNKLASRFVATLHNVGYRIELLQIAFNRLNPLTPRGWAEVERGARFLWSVLVLFQYERDTLGGN